MYGRNANPEGAAREHPMRAAILALLAKDGQTMSAPEIRAELPDEPAGAAVAYHLKVLEGTSLVSTTNGHYKLS
jgi:predicted transcriptional regulator